MADYSKIVTPGMFSPQNSNYPTHEDSNGLGGYMVAKREDIPFARRKIGMLVYDNGTIYKCTAVGTETADASWEELKLGNDLDNLEIGTRNLFAKKYMLDWNAKSAGATTVNFDDYGEYYQIHENKVYVHVGGSESYNDILQGNVSFETSKQYCLKVKWRVDSVKDYDGLYLGFKYSDGTRNSWIVCAKDQTTPAEATLVSESGKTVAGIFCTYGMMANTRIYEIQLTEGNKAPSGWAEAEADKEIGGQNLYTGDNPLTITANATNNYNYATLVQNLQNDARYVFSCGKSAVKAGSTDKYTVLLYDFNGPSSSQIRKLAVGTTRVEQAFTIPSTGTWSMLIYSGLRASTAGISMEFTDIMVQKGNKATGWTPAPEDLHTAVTDGEYPLLMKGDNVGEGYYDSEVKLNTSNNTISANISGYATYLQEFIGFNDKSSASATTNDVYNPNLLNRSALIQYHNYNNYSLWKNMPSDFLYGSVIQFGCAFGQNGSTLVGQLAYDVLGASQGKTNNLYFRAGNPTYTSSTVTTQEQAWNLSSWKRIAWADDDSAGYLRLYDQTQTGKLGSVNNIVSSGFYKVSDTGTTTDLPCNVGYGPLIVHGHQDTKLQIYANYSNSDLYFRAGTLNTDTKRLTSTWKKVVALSDLSGQIPNKAIKIKENSDLNNITTPGFYYCPLNALAETLKNCPTKLAFSLRAYKDANSVNQIVTVFYANARMYFRGGYIEDQTKELKWSSWKEIAYCQDYVKKSGDTMSGNLSIQTPTSPTLTLGSSTITYNKTTGCLEIMA